MYVYQVVQQCSYPLMKHFWNGFYRRYLYSFGVFKSLEFGFLGAIDRGIAQLCKVKMVERVSLRKPFSHLRVFVTTKNQLISQTLLETKLCFLWCQQNQSTSWLHIRQNISSTKNSRIQTEHFSFRYSQAKCVSFFSMILSFHYVSAGWCCTNKCMHWGRHKSSFFELNPIPRQKTVGGGGEC